MLSIKCCKYVPCYNGLTGSILELVLYRTSKDEKHIGCEIAIGYCFEYTVHVNTYIYIVYSLLIHPLMQQM